MKGPSNNVAQDPGIDTALWLARHGAALRHYFGRRVNPADVDDLVQEVLIRLQTADAAIASAERYLFTVARNVLIDRRRLEQTHDLGAYRAYSRIGAQGDQLSPERILLARDEYARVTDAIQSLPPRARIAFEFHRFENMTYKQIANTMKISRESVKELMHRAIAGVIAEMRKSEKPDE